MCISALCWDRMSLIHKAVWMKSKESGRGERRTVPPPEIGKIAVENWGFPPGEYTWEEAEIVQKLLKVPSREILSKNFKLSYQFSKISCFSSKHANVARRFLNFCRMESIHQMLISLNFPQITSDVLQNLKVLSS